MPITTCRAPARAPRAIASSSIGTSASVPSIENRLTPTYARAEEALEPVDLGEALEQRVLLVAAQRLRGRARLDRRRNQSSLGLVAEMLELVARCVPQ